MADASIEDFVTGYLVVCLFLFLISFLVFSIFLCVICLGYSIHDRTIEKQIDEEEIPIEGIPV